MVDPSRFQPFVPPAAAVHAAMPGAALLRITARNAGELEAEIERGLPAPVLGWLGQAAGLSLKALAPVLGASYSTLNRHKGRRERLTSDQSSRAYRLSRLVERAFEVIGSEDEARAWLREPVLALGDRTPLDALRTDLGTERVMGLLERLEDGVYS